MSDEKSKSVNMHILKLCTNVFTNKSKIKVYYLTYGLLFQTWTKKIRKQHFLVDF